MFSPTIEQHLAFQFTSSPFAPEMAYYFLYFYIAFCCRPLGKPATDWRAIFSAKLLTPAHNTHIYTRPPAHTHLLLWHARDACGVCRKCQAQRPRAGTTMPGINCWHVDVDALPLPLPLPPIIQRPPNTHWQAPPTASATLSWHFCQRNHD